MTIHAGRTKMIAGYEERTGRALVIRIDSKSEIERCLSCPLKECEDCIKYGYDRQILKARRGQDAKANS